MAAGGRARAGREVERLAEGAPRQDEVNEKQTKRDENLLLQQLDGGEAQVAGLSQGGHASGPHELQLGEVSGLGGVVDVCDLRRRSCEAKPGLVRDLHERKEAVVVRPQDRSAAVHRVEPVDGARGIP